jgi:hypothetical protein
MVQAETLAIANATEVNVYILFPGEIEFIFVKLSLTNKNMRHMNINDENSKRKLDPFISFLFYFIKSS